jgi:hypothetical protein
MPQNKLLEWRNSSIQKVLLRIYAWIQLLIVIELDISVLNESSMLVYLNDYYYGIAQWKKVDILNI